ncbi:MAG: hypothetical protein HQK55_17930, partial [Deltaproteobacteria bacterium]|nr:hypothetical protein [Deltaproteobacteria bacterium]
MINFSTSRHFSNSSIQNTWPLWSSALTAFIGAAALMVWYLPDALPLGHVSGIMVATADDIVHGFFYRPLFSQDAYGGTRYMPMFPLIHALLMQVYPDPVLTGRVMMLASVLFLMSGFYALLRGLDVRPGPAALFMLLPIAAINFMLIALEIKCDYLATGFSVWGLAAVIRSERKGKYLYLLLAATACTAAMATKLSNLNGLAASVVYLFVNGRKSSAARLGLYFLVITALVLAVIQSASDGRALEAFQACADGGMTWDYA